MNFLTNLIIPSWVKIAIPLALLAAVLGTGWGLKHSRDHWKSVANTRQTTITDLQGTIRGMTTKQDVQHEVSTRTVTEVVQGPERLRTVIRHIHDAPLPPNCATPDLPFARANT